MLLAGLAAATPPRPLACAVAIAARPASDDNCSRRRSRRRLFIWLALQVATWLEQPAAAAAGRAKLKGQQRQQQVLRIVRASERAKAFARSAQTLGFGSREFKKWLRAKANLSRANEQVHLRKRYFFREKRKSATQRQQQQQRGAAKRRPRKVLMCSRAIIRLLATPTLGRGVANM